MNDNHQRHLVGTFRYIDELLGEAAQILRAADSVSPFAKYTQDSSPLQRKVIDDYIRGIDQALARNMDAALERLMPASWAIHLVRARLHEQWRRPLADGLDNYQRNLRFWLQQAIADLRAGFQAHAAPLMAQLEARTTVPNHDGVHEVEADLKRLREFGEPRRFA